MDGRDMASRLGGRGEDDEKEGCEELCGERKMKSHKREEEQPRDHVTGWRRM
jgi:hypothetical protein